MRFLSKTIAGKLPRRDFLKLAGAGALGVFALLGAFTLTARDARAADAALSVAEAKKIALDAYIYGYSLIICEVTRVQMSNVPAVEELRAPMNTFFNVPKYPPATYRGVSETNVDTLYSVAWLDLTEPQVVSKPATGNRFWVFELADMWVTVIGAPDVATVGGDAKDFLFTGPGWKGKVPAGLTHIPVPTRQFVVLGRTFANGTEEDYKIVNAIQAQYKVTPLSSWGKPFTYKAPPVNPNPGFSMTDKPTAVIKGFGTTEYFNRVTKLMAEVASPAPEDAPILAQMAKLGIVPGKPFDPSKLSPEIQAAFKEVYGTDYLQRGAIAAFGWPGQLPTVSVYPAAFVDGKGEALNGTNSYSITFPKGGQPPVGAFWSITMYVDDQGYWFYPNELNRLNINVPRDKVTYNPDGSLTLYFQHTSPGKEKESNWLPAPAGPFVLMMRMYLPNQNSPSILNGTWSPPPVVRASK